MHANEFPAPEEPESQPTALPQGNGLGKKKWLVVGLIIIVVAVVLVISLFLLLSKPSPITVEGIQLQIGSATKQATFTTSQSTYRTNSADDEFLVVKVKLLSAETEQVIDWTDKEQVNDWKDALADQVFDWEVTVTDENGRVEEPVGYKSIAYPDISPQGTWTAPGEVTWLFVVKKTSNSFTLNLPENKTIKLSFLLNK
jgi:hypothetical protein